MIIKVAAVKEYDKNWSVKGEDGKTYSYFKKSQKGGDNPVMEKGKSYECMVTENGKYLNITPMSIKEVGSSGASSSQSPLGMPPTHVDIALMECAKDIIVASLYNGKLTGSSFAKETVACYWILKDGMAKKTEETSEEEPF